jgi:hypothetical protein
LNVISSQYAIGIANDSGGGKEVLPAPFPIRPGILADEACGKASGGDAGANVARVLLASLTKEPGAGGHACIGEGNTAVLPTFPLSHNDLTPLEIDVFHAMRSNGCPSIVLP